MKPLRNSNDLKEFQCWLLFLLSYAKNTCSNDNIFSKKVVNFT